MANQYQNFTNPTIIPDEKYGWQAASDSIGGVSKAFGDYFKTKIDDERAAKLYALQKHIDTQEEMTKNKMLSQQNMEDIEQAKKLFPSMFGESQPMQAPNNFNPMANLQGAVSSAVGGQPSTPPQQNPTIGANQPQEFDPSTGSQFKQAYAFNPNRMIDKKADMFVKNPDKSFEFGQKQDQFNQRQWTALTNKFNPAVVSSRSALGMASNGNLRADRALVTLQQPMVTNAQLGNALADLAGIYQGGAPTAFGMHEQQYTTAYQKLQSLMQFVSAKPTNVVTPEIKQKVIDTINDLKNVNNDYISQTFKSVEGSQKKLINNYQEEWQALKESWLPPEQEGEKFGQAGKPTAKYKVGETRVINNVKYTRNANGKWSST